MPQLSAVKIVGKELWAAKKVKLHTYGSDGAPVVAEIQPGQKVGVVFSWVEPEAGEIWWSFDGSAYGREQVYTRHQKGKFDEKRLMEQFTEEEQQAYFPPSSLPSYLGLVATAVGAYQASHVRDVDAKFWWRVVAFGGAAFWLKEQVAKIDLNPFD